LRRLFGRDALVLLRLQRSALGKPAARSREARADLWALASRRLSETLGRRPGSVRRRQALPERRHGALDRHRAGRVLVRPEPSFASALPLLWRRRPGNLRRAARARGVGWR